MAFPLSALTCLVLVLVLVCAQEQPVQEIITARSMEMLGGWVKRSPDSAEVKKAAQFALKTEESLSSFELVSIISAKSQVTNKINYRIKAVLAKDSCKYDKAESCTSEKLQCRFDVTFNPRKNKHQLRSHKCKTYQEKKA